MNFGPKNTQLFEVDLDTGEITPYKTSEAEAEFDVENGNVFKTKKAAQKYVDKLLEKGHFKNTLIDVTDWEDEDGVEHFTSDEIIPITGIVEDDTPLRKKLRIETAQNIAKYLKKHGSLDSILKHLKLKKDEELSVNVFIEWIENEDDGPTLTAKELCRLYKEEFIPYTMSTME